MEKLTSDSQRYYTTIQLSENISETPEGFLICENVPITRTGEFIYKDSEVPVEGDKNGVVRVMREDEVVFADATIKSFEGKPLTIEHPKDLITPMNWKEVTHGVLQNVRRGDGTQSHMMVGDLCITTEEAIKLVKAGLREVSLGYNAQYEQIEPGKAKQVVIVGNHIALVNKGRAGSWCAIHDHDSENIIKLEEIETMKKKTATTKEVY